jgi:carbon-monoxide dehydrogenase medium subunit
MYPSEFDYYRADSVQHALDLLGEHAASDPTILAGGHSLLPTMKSGLANPDVVVDVGDVEEMRGVESDGATVTIGAATRYATVAESETVREACPVLAEAAAEIGDTQVRQRGTLGGNIAHADPASDLPGVVLATDATVHAEGPDGTRTIDADDFFLGIYMTALDPDEILTHVEVPVRSSGASAYVKKPSPSSGYAMIGVGARVETSDGTVENARIGVNGAMDHPVRLDPVETALEGEALDAVEPAEVAARATDGLDESRFLDDVQASSEYRAQLLETYTRRALETVQDRA